jgi:hypothetical protein
MSFPIILKILRMSYFGKNMQFGLFWSFETGLVDSGYRGSYEDCEKWAFAAQDYWKSQGSTPTLEARIERQIKESQFLIVPVAS